MADKFQLELVSPERLLLAGEMYMVTVPGGEGEFGVLADHAPIVAALRSGVVEVIEEEGGEAERLFVRGGFAEMADNQLTILAEEAFDLAKLDREELEQRIKDVKEDIEDAEDDEVREKHVATLAQYEELLSAL